MVEIVGMDGDVVRESSLLACRDPGARAE